MLFVLIFNRKYYQVNSVRYCLLNIFYIESSEQKKLIQTYGKWMNSIIGKDIIVFLFPQLCKATRS